MKSIRSYSPTSEMVAEHTWMADYPQYYRFTEFECIDAPISECIPLREVLEVLGSDTYVSTMGKSSLTLQDLRKQHQRHAHRKLTAHAKKHIDILFDERVRKFGSKKIGI